MNKTYILAICLFIATPSLAIVLNNGESDSARENKTIVGWRDQDNKEGGSFEGCDFGRVIVFDDMTTLTCTSYQYQYAYRPDAIIFTKGSGIKMIVEGEEYDMER